mgnify:CR=1 FL=1
MAEAARIEALETQLATLMRNQTGTYSLSVTTASKLFERGFSGDPKELKDFIDNVEAAYSITDESLHPILIKYVLAKITGEAKRTLDLQADAAIRWEDIREKLETHYSVKRTFAFYCTQLCMGKQKTNETVTQWGTRVEQLVSNAIESTEKFTDNWSQGERMGGRKIIIKWGITVFINGILDDNIREAVKINSENVSMKEIIDKAAAEECDRRSNVQSYKPYNRPFHLKPLVKKETVQTAVSVKCYKCNKFGHIARECKAPKCLRCNQSGHLMKDCQVRGSQPVTSNRGNRQ